MSDTTVRAAAEGMPSINRRRLLLVAGGVTALATGIAAATAATAADAELIALGKEFSESYERFLPAWEEMCRLDDVWRSAVKERGLNYQKDGIDACFAVQAEFGTDIAIDRSNECLTGLDKLAKRIRAIKPETLAGLAVWAKVTMFDCIPMDDRAVEDMDWDKECLVRFINEVERMAGT